MKGVCKRGNISQNVSNIYLSSSVGTSFTEVLTRPARPYFGRQSIKRFRLKLTVDVFNSHTKKLKSLFEGKIRLICKSKQTWTIIGLSIFELQIFCHASWKGQCYTCANFRWLFLLWKIIQCSFFRPSSTDWFRLEVRIALCAFHKAPATD